MFLGSYFEKCTEGFPYENLVGFNILHNKKNHSIKHGGGDIAKYGHLINMSCGTPKDGRKFGSRSLGETQIRGLKQHWACCSTPFVKKPVPSFVRVFKVIASIYHLNYPKYI